MKNVVHVFNLINKMPSECLEKISNYEVSKPDM